MRKCHSHDGDKHVQETVQQDRRMETIPRAQRERRRHREPRGPDRRQKTRGERDKEKQEERDGKRFSKPGAIRARPALLMKRAYLAAECVLAENEGNSYCLVSGGR